MLAALEPDRERVAVALDDEFGWEREEEVEPIDAGRGADVERDRDASTSPARSPAAASDA